VSATNGSITSDSISESESNEKKETTAEVQSPSEKEGKRLRFPCSYCIRRFETFEEVKRHVRNGHTPRRTG